MAIVVSSLFELCIVGPFIEFEQIYLDPNSLFKHRNWLAVFSLTFYPENTNTLVLDDRNSR